MPAGRPKRAVQQFNINQWNQNNFDFLNWFVEFAAAGLVGGANQQLFISSTINPSNQKSLICWLICWNEIEDCCWLLPPGLTALIHNFISFISSIIEEIEKKLKLNGSLPHLSSIENQRFSYCGKGPNARQLSFLQSICPFGRANWRRKGVEWAGAAVSIAIPFIIPFKNSKFFHSMNMQQLYWRQITVIILFNSINWFHEFNQSMKQKREIKFIWFVFLVELMGWMNEIELPPP